MPFDTLDPYEGRRRTLDAMSAFAGVPGVQGDEAERRRQQTASMDDYLRRAGVGPERQMRIDPETASAALDAIARNPAPAAPPAPAPATARQGYAAQPIAAAPQPVYGAGSYAPIYSLSDPMIGAGILIRDNPEIVLAKMNAKREAELGAINAQIAADRNAVMGRQTDAGIFDTLTRANAEREKMTQGERFEQAAGQRHLQGLQSAEAIAAQREQGETRRHESQFGEEAVKRARDLAVYKAMLENPEKAPLIFDLAQKYNAGTLGAKPGAAPQPPVNALQAPVALAQKAADESNRSLKMPIAIGPPPVAPPEGPGWWTRNVVQPVQGINIDPERWLLRQYGG